MPGAAGERLAPQLHCSARMKTGARMNKRTALSSFLAAAALVTVSQIGCGKGDDSALSLQQPGEEGDASLPLHGYAGFGTQCRLGYNGDPKALKLEEIVACPVNLSAVELSEPLTPLMFSVDCGRKTITARTLDLSVDTTWYILPDNTFEFWQDGIKARLKSDGMGTSNCVTPVSAHIWGSVTCDPANPDKASIKFTTDMWLNKAPDPANSVGASPVPTPTSSIPPNGGSTGPGPSPSATPTPRPTPSPRPTPPRMAIDFALASEPAAAMAGPQCILPPPPAKCVFRVSSTVEQCRPR